MTTAIQTPTTLAPPAVHRGSKFGKRVLVGLLVLVLLFLGTYIFAWFNANQLSMRFFNDAETSYKGGDYLKALVGYQQFDAKTNKYINYGGYVSVEKVWSNRDSWPVPGFVQVARQRSQEIIDQKLTADQAQQYVQDNTGRPGAPYFGEIYLRLGELYEQQGDTTDAISIYQSMASLFPGRPDLIQAAKQHLAKLQSQSK